jgi:hypothetical protein
VPSAPGEPVAADRSDHASRDVVDALAPTDRSSSERPPVDPSPPIVDWARTARRLRAVLATIGGVIVVAWLAHALVTGGVDLPLLAELIGFGLFAAFVVEVVVVGGTAVRGMLAAGERGERLSGPDVSLLPPQLTRRRRR